MRELLISVANSLQWALTMGNRVTSKDMQDCIQQYDCSTPLVGLVGVALLLFCVTVGFFFSVDYYATKRNDGMGDIVRSLRRRRIYEDKFVRDTDTGEVMTMEEVAWIRANKPNDSVPKIAKVRDLADIMCDPVLPFIPKAVHPNMISITCHVVCWLVFAGACRIAHLSEEGQYLERAQIFVWLGIGNFMCMMLDCLDGMHARRTNQCSKLGEVMDHWLDAIAVPLASGGILQTVGIFEWNVDQPWYMNGRFLGGVALITTALLYNGQLVLYHYTGKFVENAGVEAQAIVSALYWALAAMQLMPEAYYPYIPYVGVVLTCITIMAQLQICAFYMKHFLTLESDDASGNKWARNADCRRCFQEHGYMWLSCSTLVLLLYSDAMSPLSFCLSLVAFSFRINGSYVLYSVVKKIFNGYDTLLVEWCVVIMWANFAMEPIPASKFYSKIVFMESNITLQQVLPIMMCAHIVVRNLHDLHTNFNKLRNKQKMDYSPTYNPRATGSKSIPEPLVLEGRSQASGNSSARATTVPVSPGPTTRSRARME